MCATLLIYNGFGLGYPMFYLNRMV